MLLGVGDGFTIWALSLDRIHRIPKGAVWTWHWFPLVTQPLFMPGTPFFLINIHEPYLRCRRCPPSLPAMRSLRRAMSFRRHGRGRRFSRNHRFEAVQS